MSSRRYDQYCPIAVALDVLGDRWTLLILRELSIADCRFTDLRSALGGIAPNLLAQRLRELQAEGLVEQRELPPPAARTVYAITDAGREALPVLRSLARFGAPRLGPRPADRPFAPSRAVYSLIAPFHAPEPAGRFHARLHVDGETFDVVTDGPTLSMRRRELDDPDIELELSTDEIVAARSGTPPQLPGGAAADRFARLFQLT